jgi:peptidyl-tRNA hydrolase
LSRGLRAGLSVAVLAFSQSEAFVPNSKAFVVPLSKQATVSTHEVLAPSVRDTQLSMVLDQFIEGRDKATRKKETDKYLAEIQKRVERINELEASIEDLGDEELQAKTEEFKTRLAKGEDINGPILEEAFAVVREAAW